MNNPIQNNPNDYKVVTFTNKETFAFTPELGSMYDGRPIFGTSGAAGIQPGESIILPYHVGNLLALNLAKAAMTRRAPAVDPAGVPTGVPLWNEVSLLALKATFLTELYTEEKPMIVTETDRLMAKVEEYKAMVEKLIPQQEQTQTSDPDLNPSGEITTPPDAGSDAPKKYQNKAEIITELTTRGIKFDPRSDRETLKKLLVD